MTKMVIIRILVDYPANSKSPAAIDIAAKHSMVAAETTLKGYGLNPLGGNCLVDNPTKDESLAFSPRKIHYGLLTYPCCQSGSGGQVAKSRVVEKWEKVTCKLCLKKRPEKAQKELFI
jgi:hypothetical protein